MRTALPAARLGAEVLGVDIARNLVDAGNRRAQAEALSEARGYDWLVVQFRIGQIEAILAWLDICTTTVIPSPA